MSRSQFQSKRFILRHAWLNLWDKRMTTGRINQVAILTTQALTALTQRCSKLLHIVFTGDNFLVLSNVNWHSWLPYRVCRCIEFSSAFVNIPWIMPYGSEAIARSSDWYVPHILGARAIAQFPHREYFWTIAIGKSMVDNAVHSKAINQRPLFCIWHRAKH